VNIYDVLHDDHLHMLDLLERLPRARRDNRRELVNELVDNITAHSQAEEHVLYNRLVDVPDMRELILKAKEEHMAVTRILEDLIAMRSDDERFEAKVAVVRDLLMHHIDEEEAEVFGMSRDTFDDDVATNFAGEFLALKAQLQDRPQLLRFGQARIKKMVEDVGHVLRPQGASDEGA
jgi:hemerythrin-like domain-containing protein